MPLSGSLGPLSIAMVMEEVTDWTKPQDSCHDNEESQDRRRDPENDVPDPDGHNFIHQLFIDVTVIHHRLYG